MIAAATGLVLSASSLLAMPDASTMKRLETVAFYIGAIDHCRIDVETDRLEAYFLKYDALEPVTWGAVERAMSQGAFIRHQPGSSHCGLVERIMRAEGIID
ncbi:hypothetical protein [Stappia sp. ES.058]|uniref:hypothetical protein n=1 Tax=Stappia sp. ES.058 TaxID=1881061 RepID=UPI000B894CF1|nr:hypothetical protein [Stappia sp. ES.058]